MRALARTLAPRAQGQLAVKLAPWRRSMTADAQKKKPAMQTGGMQIALAALTFALGLQVAQARRDLRNAEEALAAATGKNFDPQDLLDDLRKDVEHGDWAAQLMKDINVGDSSGQKADMVKRRVFSLLDNYSLKMAAKAREQSS